VNTKSPPIPISIEKKNTREVKVLFISSVFMGMGGDYFISRKIPTEPFTSLVLNEIIPRYPLPYPPIPTFFA
jgi:hypothetical protein